MNSHDFEFQHEGRDVRPGQLMHVAPGYWSQAGATAKVERWYGDSVMLRTDNGAVPTVPLCALSWNPHPETVALEEMRRAGFVRPNTRDLHVWMLARTDLMSALSSTGRQEPPACQTS